MKYSLTILNTQDRRMLRNFEQKLERRVREIKQLSLFGGTDGVRSVPPG